MTEEEEIFHSWQCISLVRKNGTTFDLVIRNTHNLLALIHVIHQKIYHPPDNTFLCFYKLLKFKMKLSFEAWDRKLKFV